MKTHHQILREALASIEDIRRWTQNQYVSRNAAGLPCFCAAGAIRNVSPDQNDWPINTSAHFSSKIRALALAEHVAEEIHGTDIVSLNDGLGIVMSREECHAAVIGVLKSAIQRSA